MKTTKNPKSSGWLARVSRVLIFTMLCSTFMHQGWYQPKHAQATITYGSAGTLAYSAANGTTVAPAYPGSIAAGDLLVLIIGMKSTALSGGSVTTPTGWTPIVSLVGAGGYTAIPAVDTGNTNLFTYYKVADGTETGTLTVTIATNNVSWAQIYRMSNAESWNVAGATGSDIDGATATVSIAFGTNPGVAANDYILGAMCIPTDAATFSLEAFSQTGVTFGTVTEIQETANTTGNDIGGFIVRAPVSSGTASAAPTMTATAGGTVTNARGPGVFIRIREVFLPPIAGTVTVSPDSGTYTSGSPTIATAFTDSEPTLTSCEYTTNGGTNWILGTVSGSSPDFICTASPTGLSGSLTINMRATSQGGTTTATSIARTVDITGPTDGILTVTPENQQNYLSWTAAVDSGAGLRMTNTYDVRFLAGAVAPTCATGTSIYTGTRTTALHKGLTNGAQYSYRVCAYDAFNNRSAGATGSGTPVAWGMSSCAACHGSVESFTDGTARNNPAGTFPGSHNEHVIVYGKACTACHVNNAANNHRNGAIEMSAVGYGKGASFAQTNSPTPFQACSTTYCHSQGVSATGQNGDNRTLSSPLTPLNWGSTGTCTSCHGSPPSYADDNTTWGGTAKQNSHAPHQTPCQTCHSATTSDGSTIADTTKHVNNAYDIAGGNGATIASYTYNAGGGTCNTISCHAGAALNAQWGVTVVDCTVCHNVAVNSPVARSLDASVKQRRAIVPEFAQTWSHKRSASGAVTAADCIVCHLEGSASTGRVDWTYHANGYIELRDPDLGTAIEGVTWNNGTPGQYNSSGSQLQFVQFKRDLDSNSLEAAATAIQINHCLKCHDSNGANSTLARVSGGSAEKPFATTIAGAGYTGAGVTANGVLGGVTDINAAFDTNNSAYHPVRGKQNNWYAKLTRMAAPWNTATRGGTVDTTSWGPLISCWDCHSPVGATGVQTDTVTAHGATSTLRGTMAVTGTPSATNAVTLCVVCHAGYDASTLPQHNTGSAWNSTGADGGMTIYTRYGCNWCHSSSSTATRPVRAQDVHGFNRLAGTGADALWPAGATETYRPYAFIRNSLNWNSTTASHKPLSGPGVPTGTATCTTGTLGQAGCTGNSMGNYSPGGVY